MRRNQHLQDDISPPNVKYLQLQSTYQWLDINFFFKSVKLKTRWRGSTLVRTLNIHPTSEFNLAQAAKSAV